MMLLDARTPADFIATHLESRQGRHDEVLAADQPQKQWRTMQELLCDDARLVRQGHSSMVTGGAPAKAAANYLMGWVGGFLGEVLGFTYAATGAGVLADASVRWRFHPGGWPDRIDLSGCSVVVTAGHAWSGQPGVETVGDPDAVRTLTVAALTAALTPYVEVLRTLAKLGRNSLWAEVADGLGTSTAASPELVGAAGTIGDLESLLHVPGAPWRTRPKLWCADAEAGPMVVGQKGGCCLAYTAVGDEKADENLDDLDPEHRAYKERFPWVKGEPSYCSTCCFRDASDVEARQILWADLMEARRRRIDRRVIEGIRSAAAARRA